MGMGQKQAPVKALLMLIGEYRFWREICCHPSNVFFMDAPAYYSKTTSNHILHVLQHAKNNSWNSKYLHFVVHFHQIKL